MAKDSRGVSNVVGVVLLVATVLSGVTVLAGVGAQTMHDQTSAIAGETTADDLETIAELAESVAYSGHERLDTDLTQTGRMRAAPLSVNEQGQITVEVGSQAGGWTTVLDRSLGTVSIEREDGILAYQSGGVYYRPTGNPDAVEVLRSPPITVRSRTATAITLPVFQVAGDSSLSGGATISSAGKRPVYDSLYVPTDQNVRITVRSRFADGWATTLEQTVPPTHRRLQHDTETNTVRLTYGVSRTAALYLHGTAHRIRIEDR